VQLGRPKKPQIRVSREIQSEDLALGVFSDDDELALLSDEPVLPAEPVLAEEADDSEAAEEPLPPLLADSEAALSLDLSFDESAPLALPVPS